MRVVESGGPVLGMRGRVRINWSRVMQFVEEEESYITRWTCARIVGLRVQSLLLLRNRDCS
jgi:hypothetical protein